MEYIAIADIEVNPNQPRIYFNDQSLKELAESIQEHGLIQPITVRKLQNKYQLIAGERRYRAHLLLKRENILANIIESDDLDSANLAIIENIQREDLNPIEEAQAYQKLLQLNNMTQEQLAKKLNKTQAFIANKLRLLKADKKVIEALVNGDISQRHARALLGLDNTTQQELLDTVLKENLTVSKLEEKIKVSKPKIRKKKTKTSMKVLNKDMRLVINTFNQFKQMIENQQYIVDMEYQDIDDGLEFVLRVRK